MSDRLASLMAHFPVSARVFNAGPLCGVNTLEGDGTHGQLHLVRSGTLSVSFGRSTLAIDKPSVLLFPRPLTHRFTSDAERGADVVCANLRFEGGAENPIASALPEVVCLPLERIDGSAPMLALLFEEAFEQRCGRTAMVERLFEVVMIQLLRQLMERGDVKGGLVSGLSHPKLRHALVAMHDGAHLGMNSVIAALPVWGQRIARFGEAVTLNPRNRGFGLKTGEGTDFADESFSRLHPDGYRVRMRLLELPA